MLSRIKRLDFFPVNVVRRLRGRFQKVRLGILLNRRTGHLTCAVMNKTYKRDAKYRSYVFSQIRESFQKAAKVPRAQDPPERTMHLVRLMNSVLPASRDQLTVICVGCRDARELDYIEATCRARAVGLDLFSVDPRINIGDMHKMPFEDSQFDCLYSCHSLEHAYDLRAALKEFVRVTKPGGVLVIEAPLLEVGKAGANDLSDVGSAKKLVEKIGDAVDSVLLQEEDEEKVAIRTANGLKVARVLARIKK